MENKHLDRPSVLPWWIHPIERLIQVEGFTAVAKQTHLGCQFRCSFFFVFVMFYQLCCLCGIYLAQPQLFDTHRNGKKAEKRNGDGG